MYLTKRSEKSENGNNARGRSGASGSAGRSHSVRRERPSSGAGQQAMKKKKGLDMSDRVPQAERFRRPTGAANTIWVKGLTGSEFDALRSSKSCVLCAGKDHFAQDCPQADVKFKRGEFLFYAKKKVA